MKTTLLVFLFIGSCFATCFAAEPIQSAVPEIIKDKVKDIVLPGDSMDILELDMVMDLPMPMKILVQVRYEKENNYSLFVFDGFDNTPMLVVSGHKAMINDPFAERVTLVASAGVAFDLSPNGEQYTANFAFNMPKDDNIRNTVKLDFTTLFSRAVLDVIASTTADNNISFSGSTEQKSRCEAVFARSGDFPLQKMFLFIEGATKPILSFTKIKTVGKIHESVFVFPDQKLEKSGVEFSEVKSDGAINTMTIVASVMRAIFSRAAIRNEGLRKDIEKMIMYAPDWEKAEKSDASRAKLLRSVFVPLK